MSRSGIFYKFLPKDFTQRLGEGTKTDVEKEFSRATYFSLTIDVIS